MSKIMSKTEIETINRIIKKIKYNELQLSESIGKRCYIKDEVVYNLYGNYMRPLDDVELELYDKIKIFKNALKFYLV